MEPRNSLLRSQTDRALGQMPQFKIHFNIIDVPQAIGSRQVFRLVFIHVLIFNTFSATRALFYFTNIAGHFVGCLTTHTAVAA